MNHNKIFSVLVLMATISLSACSFEKVDSTERCFETSYGEVKDTNMKPGLNYLGFNDATCFLKTQQQWPAGTNDDGSAKVAHLSTNNEDKIATTVDFGLTWQHDQNTMEQVFKDKRSPELVDAEVDKAIQDGFVSALASWKTDSLLGQARTSLGDSIRVHINRKMGNLGSVKKVFVTGIHLPESIGKQQELAMTAERRQTTARADFLADSLEQRKGLYQAQVDAEKSALKAKVYDQNPALLQLEVERIKAQGLQGIFSKCTQNCILGGTVQDKFFSNSR